MSIHPKKKERLLKFIHFLAGFVILMHAYERYEKGENFTFYLVAGIVFLVVAVLHHPLRKKVRWIDGFFYLVEGIVMFNTAYEFFHHEKKSLAFTFLFSGIGYLIGAFVTSIKQWREPLLHH